MKSFCKLKPVFLKIQLDNMVESEPPDHFHLTAQRSWAHFTDGQMKGWRSPEKQLLNGRTRNSTLNFQLHACFLFYPMGVHVL